MNQEARLPLLVAVAALASTIPVLAGGAAAASSTPAAATSVINGLGARLQPTLTADEADAYSNLVFSPASVGIALAMTSAGANGETLAEMNEVLGISGPAIHDSFGALAAALTGGSEDSFNLANSLWVQDGFVIEDAFATTLTDTYRSEPFREDFEGDPATAVADINSWVADATSDRITELLSEGDITALTRLVVANAVYLDAEWVSPFTPESTRADRFTRGDDSSVEVEFMRQTLHAEYGEANGAQAIVLPYTNGYEMVVVLPPAGGLGEFERALAESGDLDLAIGQLADREVVLSLPKWDIETRSNLVPALQTMGLTLPFDGDRADFTNISSEVPLVVSNVVHQANITVDEAGTEAAAATAVIVEVAGALPAESQPPPVVMDVDRPFFFAIRHAETGTVAFQGHVDDPAAAAGFG